MKGIEYFTALQELICGHNHGLTSLNVSANKALTKLDCSACGLTSLDVSQNTALKELICYNNSLTSLDVSANTALELLRCEYNTLTSLTVSKTNNTALKDVYCGGNQISGAAMTNLVNGLPTVTGDHGFNVCDDTQKTDNVITPAQVKTATDKGWMVLKFNGSCRSSVRFPRIPAAAHPAVLPAAEVPVTPAVVTPGADIPGAAVPHPPPRTKS